MRWTRVVHAQNACRVVWELLSLPALILSKGNISLSILVIIGNIYALLLSCLYMFTEADVWDMTHRLHTTKKNLKCKSAGKRI
jgi:hypothetical protein